MAKDFAKAFYSSKAWQSARAQTLKRDGYVCRDCGAWAQEVHHIVELTPSNINDPQIAIALNNLASLCHDCHTKITQDVGDVDVGYRFDEGGQVVRRQPPYKA